jgi:hypothetical protein
MVLGTVLLCWLVLWPTWIWCGSDNTCQCRWCGHAVPRYVFRPVTVSRPVTFSRCGDPCYGQQVTHASPSEPERWAFVLRPMFWWPMFGKHISLPPVAAKERMEGYATTWVLLWLRSLPPLPLESSFGIDLCCRRRRPSPPSPPAESSGCWGIGKKTFHPRNVRIAEFVNVFVIVPQCGKSFSWQGNVREGILLIWHDSLIF